MLRPIESKWLVHHQPHEQPISNHLEPSTSKGFTLRAGISATL
ncbi:hypothetical protein [Azomonas agilis]|nr:hypothetical protein [Azomonas agilis]